MRRLARSALLFTAIGLALYGGVYWAAERLLVRTGRSNPLFKIAAATDGTFDWVILGASHAMPLDFDDFNAAMERDLSLRILNLAAPGAGPLYNRFVLEGFLRERRGRNLLYVVDSFAFYSRTWNEDRFADAKLLRRTPLEGATARRLLGYVLHEGVDARALLDYATGFSKVGNPERFRRDAWEGEAQFEQAMRPSTSAVKKRIAYLYPEQTSPGALERYLAAFASLVDLAQREGMRVVVVKTPVPPGFRGQLPGEAAFDEALGRLLATRQVLLHDFSGRLGEPRFYFDTDHLNRAGLTEFLARDLRTVLEAGRAK